MEPLPTRAVRERHNVVLEGLRLARDRVVRVVAALPAGIRANRDIDTAGQAAPLVELGLADRVRPATVVRFPDRL